MTSTPIHDDLTVAYELRVLDNLLDDECRCEGQHKYSPCSYKVVALLDSCKWRFLTCASGRDFILKVRGRSICKGCERVATDCWRIIPV